MSIEIFKLLIDETLDDVFTPTSTCQQLVDVTTFSPHRASDVQYCIVPSSISPHRERFPVVANSSICVRRMTSQTLALPQRYQFQLWYDVVCK